MDETATPDTHPVEPRPAPIAQRDRIQALDVLRGLALLGILLPNIADMSFPSRSAAAFQAFFPGVLDRVVLWGVALLVQGKLYTMFSFLFGIGVAIQYERAQARGLPFARQHLRRLLVLLVIGLLHDVFIWSGLILLTYAVVGVFILPFLRRKPRTLLIWAIVLILIPLFLRPAVHAVTHRVHGSAAASRAAGAQDTQNGQTQTAPSTSAESTTESTTEDAARSRIAAAQRESDRNLERFIHGTYADQLRYRLGRLPRTFIVIAMVGSYILGMFLLGLLSWRCHLWTRLAEQRARLVRLAAWGLPIGSALAVSALLIVSTLPGRPGLLVYLGITLANVALCLGYIGLVTLALRTAPGRRLLLPLAPVGRTALSNYILQSLIGTTIFYSYGLGLYSQVGPALNLLIVLLIWAFQIALSTWWVERFRFGPVEWAWRTLTYGRLLPIRIRR
jgi:uncharacterized protein